MNIQKKNHLGVILTNYKEKQMRSYKKTKMNQWNNIGKINIWI